MEIRRRHDNPNQNIGKLSGHHEPFNPYKQAFNETKKQAEKKEVSSPVDSQKKTDEMKDKYYLSRYGEQTKEFLRSKDGALFYEIHRQFTDLSDEIQNYGMKDFRKVMEYNRKYKEEYDKNLAKLAEMFNQKEKVTDPIKLQKQYNDLSEQTLHTLDPVIKDMEIRFETKLRELQKEMNEKSGSFSKYPENVQRQINALQEKRSAYIETYKKSNEQTDDQLGQQLELSNDAMKEALLQSKKKRDSGYRDEVISSDEPHKDVDQTLSKSSSSSDSNVYRSLGYEVPNGREGMVHKTVKAHLEEGGFPPLPKDRQWMLNLKLGNFQEFWANEPLEFEKLAEVRPQPSPEKRGAVKYPGELGEVQLGRGETRRWEPWEVPKVIGNKEVVNVPADGDCATHALLRASGETDELRIRELIKDAREYMVKEGWAKPDDYFDLGTEQGKELMRYLRDEKKVQFGEGGVRVHWFSDKGKLVNYGVLPGIKGQRQSEVFLINEHYRALVDTGKSSHEHEKAPMRVNETSKVDSPAERELTRLLLEEAKKTEVTKVTKEDDGRSIKDLEKQIAEKVESYQEVGIPVDKIYRDVKSKNQDIAARENISDEQLKGFLNEFDDKLSRERLLDLGRKLAPQGYEQAVENYFETLKPETKHLKEIVDLLEAEKDVACKWLFDNRSMFDPYKTDAPMQKMDEFYKTMQGGHINSLERHFEERSKELSFMLDNPVITEDEYRNASTKVARAGEFENNFDRIRAELLKEFKPDQVDEMDQTPEYYKHLGDMEKSLQEAIKFMESELPRDQAERIDSSLGDEYKPRYFDGNKDKDKDLSPTPSSETKESASAAEPIADILHGGRYSLRGVDFTGPQGIGREKFFEYHDKIVDDIKGIENRLREERKVTQQEINKVVKDYISGYQGRKNWAEAILQQEGHYPDNYAIDQIKSMENIKAILSKFELKQKFVGFGENMAENEFDAQKYGMKSAKIYDILEGTGASKIVINRIMEAMEKDKANIRQFFDTSGDTEIDADTVSNWLRSQLEMRSASPIEPPATAASQDSSVWNQNHPIIEAQ